MSRVYICHTFYHVYVATIRELGIKDTVKNKATLILSTMSNDFSQLDERVRRSEVFQDVLFFDEKRDTSSEAVMKYHQNKKNIFLNLLQRIKYTKLLGQLQEEFIPLDLSTFDDVYVFCDSDPIGYYLNYKKIKYHALEDGLNSGKLDNQAMLSNKGLWPLKKILSKLGFIFIECGYSKYCIDYIVNDISANFKPPANIAEWPFLKMWTRLSSKDHDILADIFIENIDELKQNLETKTSNKPIAMILTEPLCELDVRKKLFEDIINLYSDDYSIIIKPHPRDLLDYATAFPDVFVIKGSFPMEVINDISGLTVDKLISVITQVDQIQFAKEIDYLGLNFLDKYEPPSLHRKMEELTGKEISS